MGGISPKRERSALSPNISKQSVSTAGGATRMTNPSSLHPRSPCLHGPPQKVSLITMAESKKTWSCSWNWCSFQSRTRAERNAHLCNVHLSSDALDRECKVLKSEWDTWSRVHLGADSRGDDGESFYHEFRAYILWCI